MNRFLLTTNLAWLEGDALSSFVPGYPSFRVSCFVFSDGLFDRLLTPIGRTEPPTPLSIAFTALIYLYEASFLSIPRAVLV